MCLFIWGTSATNSKELVKAGKLVMLMLRSARDAYVLGSKLMFTWHFANTNWLP